MRFEDVVIGEQYGILVSEYRKPSRLVRVTAESFEEIGGRTYLNLKVIPQDAHLASYGRTDIRISNGVKLMDAEQIARRQAASEMRADGTQRVKDRLLALGLKENSSKGFRLKKTKGATPQFAFGWEAVEQLLDMIPGSDPGRPGGTSALNDIFGLVLDPAPKDS